MNVKKEIDTLVILVDLDSVLADFQGGWIKTWNATYPDRQIPYDHPWISFEMTDTFKEFGTWEEIRGIFSQDGFYLNLEPLPNAIFSINQMANCSDVVVKLCTAPTFSKTCWQDKADWVEHYLGKEWLGDLIITKDKTMVHANYLIDDKPEITGVYDPTWEHIIFDQPYNQQSKGFRITWADWPSLFLYHGNRE